MKKNLFIDTAIRYILSFIIALVVSRMLYWTIAWCIY